MAFQSRFRETERHAFGERGGQGGEAASGEPSEVRTNAIVPEECAHSDHTQPLAASDIASCLRETSP